MKKLVKPNRIGGFPLTGEALEILAKDMPEYINAIFDKLVPLGSIVFLSDNYVYVKWCNYMEIMEYTLSGITIDQLLNGSKSVTTISTTSADDVVNGTTYEATRTESVITIEGSSDVQLDAPRFYTIETLLRVKLLNETDYIEHVTASSQTIDNISISGHAIIKDGYADINLNIEFTGSGTITVDFPEEFNCNYGMLVLLYMNEATTDYNYIKGALRHCQLQFESVAGNIPRSLGLYLHYRPDEIQAL